MTAEALLDRALARPALLHGSRLVCVDGPAGSGKTTLASALVAAAHARGLSTALVHLDDLYEGWAGLTAGADRVRDDVVAPLAAGRPGRYARYDWHRGTHAEMHVVLPAELVVLEGVGAGQAGYADLVTLLVWVDAPRELRLRRGLERDGAELRPQWLAWMADEDRWHDADRTRTRAHVHVDGVTGRLSPAPERSVPGSVSQGMPAN